MGQAVNEHDSNHGTEITIFRPTGPHISVSAPMSLGQLVVSRASKVPKSIVRGLVVAAGIGFAVLTKNKFASAASISVASAFVFHLATYGILSLGFQPGSPSYNGLCNKVHCDEAYSMTRAMARNYNGPLFQLWNGTTTLDVGQASNRTVDMTTWSAFCGGVQSNCVVSKIYAQIHTTSNDLWAAQVVNQSHTCMGDPSTPYLCAAPFTIEAATGLPWLKAGTAATNNSNYVIHGTDVASTGIPGGANAVSLSYNGMTVQAGGSCCGQFGITHNYGVGDIVGTDFMFWTWYGNQSGNYFPCAATSFCLGAEEESSGDYASYGTADISFIGVVSFDGIATVAGYINDHTIFSNDPPNSVVQSALPLVPGNFIHLAGGGDSSTTPTIMREATICNCVYSTTDLVNMQNDTTSFYSWLSFP